MTTSNRELSAIPADSIEPEASNYRDWQVMKRLCCDYLRLAEYQDNSKIILPQADDKPPLKPARRRSELPLFRKRSRSRKDK